MTKLKKQLTGFKIRRFFKTSNLVLFFHYNSNTHRDWHAINTKLSFLGEAAQKAKQADAFRHKTIKASTAEISSLFLKNKIAQKVLATYVIDTNRPQVIRTKYKTQEFLHEMLTKQKFKEDVLPCCTEEQKHLRMKDPTRLNFDSKNLSKKQNDISKQMFPLFQGPTILLAFNNILLLESVLKIYKQENSLVLLGGFYNNKALLNQNDIKKLAQVSQNNWNALSIAKELQKGTQPALLFFKKTLELSILNAPQCVLLQLLNFRKRQLTFL